MKQKRMKHSAKILIVQFVLILILLIGFLVFFVVSKSQKYQNIRNIYTIEVHYDPENYAAVYTTDSYSTSLKDVLDELNETGSFHYQETNGIITEVNGIVAEDEKTAHWIAKVNWDQEYMNINEVVGLEDNYNIWLLYTQDQW